MSAEHFDVVIVGGGMVGASLACALSNTTLRVAVIESTALLGAGHAPSRQPSFDARSTALSLSSARFLDGLGLWQAVRGHAQAIQRIHVSDRGHFGSTRMDAREEGLEALGFVVENQWLGSAQNGQLADSVRSPQNHDRLLPVEVEAIKAFALRHPRVGYRKLSYMMLDQNIVAVSESAVYRTLREAGLLNRWKRSTPSPGS